MKTLQLKPNFAAPDDVYEMLISGHEGLSDDESNALNARLILILANHIGEADILREALRIAKTPSQEEERL
ncbi:DUF2783 domain-containing protein [Celeribacter sp.]|uniref:DUF2783 domain-containing protein n=1 Tax=Celeribacter sp. TaxID=1890673 RepID=UPI003A927C09